MKNVGGHIDERHDRNHEPGPGDNDAFQESWAFSWYDPATRIGGWQHLGMQRPRGIADINSYISRNGKILTKYENLALPMPDGDFTDLGVGPFSIVSRTPLKEHQIGIEHGGVRVELTMESFVGPFGMGHQDADSHWESFGRVQGVACLNGEEVRLSGLAFQDRSWGSRDMSSLLAWRLATAIFDDTLIFRLFQMTRMDGHTDYGFVIDEGQFRVVRELVCGVVHGVDGAVRSVAIDVWTVDGKGYRLSGQCVDSDLVIMRDGLMSSHGNVVYECGGRLGSGFLDVMSLRNAPPWIMEEEGRVRSEG